jgi:glutamate synthase domain-containing protein 3
MNQVSKSEQQGQIIIDARQLHYRELNSMVKQFIAGCPPDGQCSVTINNVLGQRYIGDGTSGRASIKIYGIPGNDLAAFMDGPAIEVFGNGQDGIGNTMNAGRIIIHGDAGDIMGYSMRGGEIYVKGNVGWRSGIHMKSYLEKFPVIVIGGCAGNFLGEYLAGGLIIVLGLNDGIDANEPGGENPYYKRFYSSNIRQVVGNYVGTGMHGGAIFLRGDVEEYKMGKEVHKLPVGENDIKYLKEYILNFCNCFGHDYEKIISKNFGDFVKLSPYSHRPYGKLYAY